MMMQSWTVKFHTVFSHDYLSASIKSTYGQSLKGNLTSEVIWSSWCKHPCLMYILKFAH